MQVHAGLIHGVVELLHTAERGLTDAQIQQALQPRGLGLFHGESQPIGVVPFVLEAAEWLELIHHVGDVVELSTALQALSFDELTSSLPGVVRRQLLSEPALATEGAVQVRDLVDALAWFLAQDAWEPPLKYEQVENSAEQRQRTQFPNGPEFVNDTKWLFVCRWAFYLGLAAMDPINGFIIPDPTSAVRDVVRLSPNTEWDAPTFLSFLAKEVAVLDGGEVRRRIMQDLAPDQLHWERDPHAISPALTLALKRLDAGKEIGLIHEADTKPGDRRTLTSPQSEPSLDRVRIYREAERNDD